MHQALSVYLDALRFLAALAVYLFHAGHFSGVRIPFFGEFGSPAVMVFFVLSGLVIAYASAARRSGPGEFAVARLARLWSVVLPALGLTLLLDTLGQRLALASYAPMQPYDGFKWLASL